jgi:branched-chain amino acid transport system substrate-binding protein
MIGRRGVLRGIGAATALSVSPVGVLRAQAPIKVGVIGSTSGIVAAAGQAARRGAETAAVYLKDRGGPPMELLFADTESRPENGRVSAERLIREGCPILIGSIDSGATISTAQVTEAAKIPLLVHVGSSPQITESGYTQVFRNFTKTTTLLTGAVEQIKEMIATAAVQPRTAVLMYVNDTFGQAASKSVNTLWEGLKIPIKILDQITYDVRAKDLSVEVAKAKALNPDILLTLSRVNDGILIVREMVKQNFNPMAVIFPGSPGSYEKPFTDSLGKYGDDVINCVPWYDAKNPRTKDVLQLSEKMFPGHRFDLNSIFAFEGVEIVADALKRAASAQPDAITAALRSTMIRDHISTGGPIQFDDKGQNNNIKVVMLQNRKQEPLVVGPAEFAVEKPRFPMIPFNKR